MLSLRTRRPHRQFFERARLCRFVRFTTECRRDAVQGACDKRLDFLDQVRRQQLAAGNVCARERQVEAVNGAAHRFIKLQEISAGIVDGFSQVKTRVSQLFAFGERVGRALGQPGRELAFDQTENEDGAITTRAQAVRLLRHHAGTRQRIAVVCDD